MSLRSHSRVYRSSAEQSLPKRSKSGRKANVARERTTFVLTFKQIVIFCVFLAAFTFLAWRIVQTSVAQALLNLGQYEAALEWQSSNTVALDALAEHELGTANATSITARDAALAALMANPLDDRAMALMGLNLDREGDHELAAKLMQKAGSRSRRYPLTQAWLFSYDAGRKEYISALHHLDALMRLNEENVAPFFSLAASFTIRPDSSKALSDYLAQSPPWRPWFLGELAKRLRSRENLVELFKSLQRTAAPPTNAESSSLLDRLVNDREYQLAREVAVTLQGAPALNDLLYNGDFSRPLTGSPFNWRIKGKQGVEIDVAAGPDGPAELRLDFAGRVPLSDVEQVVVLPPGLWSFSGEVRATKLESDMGVGWRLRCADSNEQLMQPVLETGTFNWRKFSIAFRVPQQGCKAQRLTVDHPARVASEEIIRGQIWYRHLQIAAETDGSAR
jgi:hypothetical protein